MNYKETNYYQRLTKTDEQKNEAKLEVSVDRLKNKFRVSLNTEQGLLIDAEDALKNAKEQVGNNYDIVAIKTATDTVEAHKENIAFIKGLYSEEFGEELV